MLNLETLLALQKNSIIFVLLISFIMKKNLLLFSLFLLVGFGFAQPNLIKYQGVARNSAGNALVNQTIALKVYIRQSSATGVIVYSESHLTTTNQFGLFYINVGGGSSISGTFTAIPWGQDSFYQETLMDPTGGTSYVSMGVSQFLSVPYALYAKNGGCCGFKVTLNGGFAVGPLGTSQINFDTEAFDDGNNISGGIYTAPSAGFYHFDATIAWSSPSGTQTFPSSAPIDGSVLTARLESGSSVIFDAATVITCRRGNTTTEALKINTNVWLNAGQTVNVKATNNDNTITHSVQGGNFTSFSGYRIY